MFSPRSGRRPARSFACALTLSLTLALALSSCASAGGSGEGAASGGRGAREDRVLLTRFDEISGIAIGRRYVYLASPSGLAVYDRQFDAWLPPLSASEGFPRNRIAVMAADPTTDGVWIGGFGEVVTYRPDLEAVQRALVPGQVQRILFDSRDYAGGAYVASAGQWTRVTETGFAMPVDPSQLPPAGARVSPPTAEEIYREFPSLRTMQGLLARDERSNQSFPVTAAARAPDRSEVWLGTWGGGAFEVDPLFGTSRPRAYGLLTEDATALALALDGVWVAGAGSARGGLSFASTTLQRWRWLEPGQRSPLLGARATDLAVRGSRAWVASDRGVARIDTRSENDVRSWSMTNGLPSDRALSVAVREAGAWVGTTRGLVFVSDTGRRSGRAGDVSRTIAADVAVRALLLTGDTLWIGTDAGLLLLPPGQDPDSARPVRAAAQAQEPALGQAITALAREDSIVVIATRDALVQLNVRTGRALPRLPSVDIGRIGGVESLAMDGRTIWAAGPRGVLVVLRDGGLVRLLGTNADYVGAGARDVVLGPDFAWLATRDGVVRLRRRADGTPP